MNRVLIAILLLFCADDLFAQEEGRVIIDGTEYDYRYTPIDQSNTTASGGGSGLSFLAPIPVGQDGYISYMIAPAYTVETNLLLGAAVSYSKYNSARLVAGVSQQKLCDVSLFGSVSISGYYAVGLEGWNTLDKRQRQRLHYGANVGSEPSRIWGIDYASALGSTYHKYTEKEYSAWLQYLFALRDFTIGAYVDYRYVGVANLDDGAAEILRYEQRRVSTAGIGISLAYDSRQEPIYEHGRYSGGVRGVYAMIEAVYRPELLSNIDRDILHLRATFDYYQPLWRGGLLALDIYGETVSSAMPWLLSPKLGGDSRMRGYYAGRLRGDYLASAQVELRQHIWNGLGVVAWGGAGMALYSEDSFSWQRVLPTYGAGLRYSYAPLTIRFDVAFGCDGPAFILGLNEAF